MLSSGDLALAQTAPQVVPETGRSRPSAPSRVQPGTTPGLRPVNPPDYDSAAAPRWHRRPWLRVGVKLIVALAPAAAALAVAIAFSRTWPLPGGLAATIAWWALFMVATLATWTLFANLLQRILPLATLLDLTLAFPYSPPSRLAMLRRDANPRQLESELRRLRQKDNPETAIRAQLILEFAVALTIHDSRTGGHSERVRMFTDLVAKELHLRHGDADRLRWAALLHDIGKLAVAPELLNKADFPDDDELDTLRNHPIEGYRLIAPLHQWLGSWADTVRDHHERFDGTGYPDGLRGSEISLGGRIVAVTDSFETMTSGRPYRMPLTVRAAREELVRRSGTHFDPVVVRAFLAVSVGRLWPAVAIGALVAGVPLFARISGRLSHLGLRSVSAVATAGATATLLATGVLGPRATVQLLGPSSAGPAVASTIPATVGAGLAIKPVPQSSPQTVSSGTTSTIAAAPASAPAFSSQATAGPPSVNAAPLYPAGISRHATLPPGIAKNPTAFAQWRKHH